MIENTHATTNVDIFCRNPDFFKEVYYKESNELFKEIVPLFMINFKRLTKPFTSPRGMNINGKGCFLMAERLEEVFKGIEETSEELSNFTKGYKNLLLQYVNTSDVRKLRDINLDNMVDTYTINNSSYDTLFSRIALLETAECELRDRTYVAGWGGVREASENKLLFQLAVRREHIPYVKMCVLTFKQINPKVFVMLVQEGFDSGLSTNKLLRTQYRKRIKSQLAEHNIPTIEVDFTTLWTHSLDREGFMKGKVKSISDINKWRDNMMADVVKGELAAIKFYDKTEVELI